MSETTLRPNGTHNNAGDVTGASAHAALSDESDATFVEFDFNESAKLALEDITLPAEAFVYKAQLWARDAAPAGSTRNSMALVDIDPFFASSVDVTWTNATDHLVVDRQEGYSDADLDGAALSVSVFGNPPLRVFEAYVKVLYLTKPSVVVDSPTGTITTQLPEITWTGTYDADSAGQSAYRVKIYTDAEYTAPGFDPDTTPTTIFDSGAVSSAQESHQLADPLVADTYRAYVRVSQNVPGQGTVSGSDFAFSEFTVNASPPNDPVVTATAQAGEGRVQIDVHGSVSPIVTDWVEIERSIDAGVTWEPIRRREEDSALSAPYFDADASSIVRAWDYEAPNGTATTYRARGVNESGGAAIGKSDWVEAGPVTWDTTQWWLKAADGEHLAITIHAFPETERAARQGVHNVLGRSTPVVITDSRQSISGTVTLQLDNKPDRVALASLLDKSLPLLLQGPDEDGWPPTGPDVYVAVGTVTSQRGFDKSFAKVTLEQLPFNVVSTPGDAFKVTDHPNADA